MVNFDKLNRETREYSMRNVDRFNPSTSSNYNYFDPCHLNAETFRQNNGQYHNPYDYR